MSSIYIHIPFCKTRCHYCDFYKSTSYAKADAFIEALEREMEYRKDTPLDSLVETVYLGGGTPSVLPAAAIQKIFDLLAKYWDLNEVFEVTMELNPDDATEEYLRDLAATPVNRLSFGIQSYIDRDLQFLNRRHTAQQAMDAVKTAQDLGFNNISVDLIYGIPGMTLEEWEKNILKAASSGVQHISAYHLTIEPGTVFGDMVAEKKLNQVSEEMSEQQYLMIHRLLSDAEFDHYEISNYAMNSDYRGKHNCNYWCGGQYIGLGPSAHSYDGEQRSFAVSSVDEYIAHAGTPAIYERETLSKIDKYNEFVMVALRTCCGVRRDILTEKFGPEWLLYFEFAAQKFIKRGLLVRDQNEYKIPAEKLMISDGIIRDLFYESEE